MEKLLLTIFLTLMGTTGVQMQLALNACDVNNPCGPRGKCEIYEGEPKCRCNPGYSGKRCRKNCELDCVWYRDSKCVVEFPRNKARCVCEEGLAIVLSSWHLNKHGGACVSEKHECVSTKSFCKNRGTCTDNGNYELTGWCECQEGFYGKRCELRCKRDICNKQPNTRCRSQWDNEEPEKNNGICICEYKYEPIGSESTITQSGCRPEQHN